MPSVLRMELRSSAGVVCIPRYWSIPAAPRYISLSLFFTVYECLSARMYVYLMCAGASRDQRKAWDPQEFGLQMAVICQIHSGSGPRSSVYKITH